MMWTCHNVR